MKRLSAAVGLGLAGMLVMALVPTAPAVALDASDIRLSALSVNQGAPIGVQVNYLYDGSTCKVWLDGPKKSPVKTVLIKRYTMRTSLPTSGLPTGTYVVRVNCGKGGRATSEKIGVVPKGAPTKATCEVTEKGFSAGADGETSYGAQITNRSPLLTATSVQLSIAYLDGAGNPLATESSYVMDIAPGESVYDGGYKTVGGVASIRIDAVCESTTTAPESRLRGQAQYIRPRDSQVYPTQLGGTIVNPLPYIIASSSPLYYVTRNAAGQITGGGTEYIDAFIPVGATGTWEDLSVMYPADIASVDWVLDPRKQ